MRYFAEAKIDGASENGSPAVQASVEATIVEIYRDKDGQGWIKVSFAAPDYHLYKPTIQLGLGNAAAPHVINVPANPYYPQATEWMQYIESVGSFWFGIDRIHWETAKHGWIPESETEKAELQLFSASHSASYPPRLSLLNNRSLQDVLEIRPQLNHLVIPVSFVREGANEYRNQRYIMAYFQFYFFFEGLYGNGKTKNRDVEREFLNSSHLKTAAEMVLGSLENGGKHEEALRSFAELYNVNLDSTGLLQLFVRLRGELHHYSVRSTRPKGHPLNQQDYHSPAFIAMSVCIQCLVWLLTRSEPS